LGLALKMQGKIDEAYDAFYKSCWNAAMQCCGYYALAAVAAMKGNFRLALEHADNSIIRNYHNYKARNLKTALYRKLGEYDKALACATETLKFDILDYGARNELYLIYKELGKKQPADDTLSELLKIMRGCENNYIELSLDYADVGMYDETACVLQRLLEEYSVNSVSVNPMAYYYLGWYYEKSGDSGCAQEYYKKGAAAKPDFCFPNKLSDIIVLESAIKSNPSDAKAYCYLGNLWYDKKQYSEAIKCWEKSKDIDDTFPTVHRNLSLAYYNKLKDTKAAMSALERAFELDPYDSRVFFELDQLYKRIGVSISERLSRLEKHKYLVESRDDLYIEYITLLNLTGDFEKAYSLIMKRKFHPWEGGEGKVTKQYVLSLIEIGKKHLRSKNYACALDVLTRAVIYPPNLGEGKLSGAQENDLNFYIGCAYEGLGENEKARECFGKASSGLDEPGNVMFYNDVPPEMIFYQGLAHINLGELEKAKEKFNKLINYGENHLHDNVTIDYFAVSLPDFLIFDDDLNKRNEVLCRYLLGLGYMGLGNLSRAKEEFERVLTLDASHIGVFIHSKMIKDNTFNPYV
ncbi:MAG: tetratricopeptide repeat protein, partial [Eubacteriales bacterium]